MELIDLISSAGEVTISLDKLSLGVISQYKEKKHDSLYVVDLKNRLRGVVDLKKFRTEVSSMRISDLVDAKAPKAYIRENPFSVFQAMLRNEALTFPVVDDASILRGYIDQETLKRFFSPERLYIEAANPVSADKDNLLRHLARYRFAAENINRGTVLDCACGSGYGSVILAEKARKVFGVDVSESAIAYAKEKNFRNNIEFFVHNLNEMNLPPDSFDYIVSFETLEHISYQNMVEFLKKIRTSLKPGGHFFGSSAMLSYKDNMPYITNPYHINEMPRQLLLDTIQKYFGDFILELHHQKQDEFPRLQDESTGFCLFHVIKTVY